MTELLDHGYLKVIETWGSDERIIEAARMSTDKGFQGWKPNYAYKCDACGFGFEQNLPMDTPRRCSVTWCTGNLQVDREKSHAGDAKLLAYLYKHHHDTPFEMAGAIIEVKAPLMVFREWHRHRTQSYNELSARYVPLPNENYVPELSDLVARSEEAATTANRQAGGTGKVLDLGQAFADRAALAEHYAKGQELYERFLRHGWPKELARLVTPVGRYSRMRASANLRNWLGFLRLRESAKAQKEIRGYAMALCVALTEYFPRTLALYTDETH